MLFANCVLMAASLQVNNPYSSNWNAQTRGNIDSVAFDVYKQGFVTKFEMTIAFAAPANYFNVSDTLEVIYNFEFPAQTILTDAWLWIDGIQKPAVVFSKGTAINAYENIVHRVRRDPLLLYKNTGYYDNNERYTAKIFPMRTNEKRCIKLSCLIPSVYLNFNQLLENILVSGNTPDLVLRTHDNGKVLTKRLNYASYSVQPNVSEIRVVDTVSFLSSYKDKSQYYACSFNPKAFLGIPRLPRKTIFVLDSALLNCEAVLNEIRLFCSKNEYKNDSVCYLSSACSDARWYALSSSSIDEAGKVFGSSASKYNCNELLHKAFLIKDAQAEDCRIVFLSSSFRSYFSYTNYYYYVDYSDNSALSDQALTLFESLKKESLHLNNLFILDLDMPQYVSVNVINGYPSYTSKYFTRGTNSYTNTLAGKIPGGVYSHYGYKNIATNLQDIYKLANEEVRYMAYRIDAHKGVLFGQYDISLANSERCLAVGQARGVDSITLHMSGLWRDSVYARRVSFALNTKDSDTTAKNIWAGVYIQNMESISPQSSLTEKEIIANSVQYHILSKYSAFMTLEDGLTVENCDNCPNRTNNDWDWPVLLIDLNDQLPDDSVSVYPNPCSEVLHVTISDIETIERIELHNNNGDLISVVQKNDVLPHNKIETAYLPDGMYFVKLIYQSKIEYYKVVKM